VMDSMGLFHAVTSYCGQIGIAVTSCREMLPDPAFYAECLQTSYDEICEAASRQNVAFSANQDQADVPVTLQ